MSNNKRRATNELNHDNWDQDDDEPEIIGESKPAPQEVLDKRVIKTARRRNLGGQPKLNVFSSFGGINKPAPSFDFLANLTKSGVPESKPSNGFGSATLATSTPVSSASIFGNGIGNTSLCCNKIEESDKNIEKSANEGFPNSDKSKSPFNAGSNIFGGSSLFPKSTQNDSNNVDMEAKEKSFGFQFKPTKPSGNSSLLKNSTEASTISNNIKKSDEPKQEEEKDQNEIKFYAKLQSLNESVLEWIQKHVSESPICILTPIFRDYERYLKEIESILEPNMREKIIPKSLQNIESSKIDVDQSITGQTNNQTSKKVESYSSKPAAFANNPVEGKQSSNFSFGITQAESSSSLSKSPSNNSTSPTSQTKPSLFSLPPSSSIATNAPFSFGTGQPFTFSANTVEKKTVDDEEDEDEKIEPPPDVKHEENSVYDKKCKVFVKKDSNFIDKGVGMLYIKPLENKKNQLLIRANTTVGHILLNFILSDSIPLQRMGKNNVMMICIPTPDSKPPPVPVLVRVKTAEEADELLEALKKYKT